MVKWKNGTLDPQILQRTHKLSVYPEKNFKKSAAPTFRKTKKPHYLDLRQFGLFVIILQTKSLMPPEADLNYNKSTCFSAVFWLFLQA